MLFFIYAIIGMQVCDFISPVAFILLDYQIFKFFMRQNGVNIIIGLDLDFN